MHYLIDRLVQPVNLDPRCVSQEPGARTPKLSCNVVIGQYNYMRHFPGFHINAGKGFRGVLSELNSPVMT